MSQIAEMANVSAMTVSRALNNPSSVAPQTRAKVLDIARRVGYDHFPNALSRMLRGERSRSIGVLACFARPNLTGEVLYRIGKELFDTSYVNYIVDTYSDQVVTLQALKTLAERRTEGVIYFVTGNEMNESIAGMLKRIGSSVIVTHTKLDMPFSQIYCGWDPGVEQVVKYFKARGCRRPVLLKESANAACHQAFERACSQYGIKDREVMTISPEKLEKMAENNESLPGDAIFASSEKYHPAIEILTGCGRKIPLVLLMDDFLITHVRPEYPVLRRREPEAGVLAVKMLFEQINRKNSTPEISDLPMEFLENIQTVK